MLTRLYKIKKNHKKITSPIAYIKKFVLLRHMHTYTHVRIYAYTYIHTRINAFSLRSNALKYQSNINYQLKEKNALKCKFIKKSKKITKLLHISKIFIYCNILWFGHKKKRYHYRLSLCRLCRKIVFESCAV